MQKVKEQLVLRKEDYNIIMGYLKGGAGRHAFDKQNAEELEAELKKAKLVGKDQLPEDVVCLNSKVTIKVEKENKLMEVMLVTPEKADIKQKKISIMSPIGTALIGFRKGNRVNWEVPSGKRTFTIIDVINNC